MSQFSHVDAAADIAELEAYLDRTSRGLGAMKHCIVGAHVAAGSRVVLDIGCGVGHDLSLLAGAGITAIGVEPTVVVSNACCSTQLSQHSCCAKRVVACAKMG